MSSGGDALSALIGGWFGYKGTKDTNLASAEQAQKAMDFSAKSQQKQMDYAERMSNTSHQRQMADLRRAGLNPILSAKLGGSSTPAGSSAQGVAAPVSNKARVALESMATAQNIANMREQKINTTANTNLTHTQNDIAHNQWKAGLGAATLGEQYNNYLNSKSGKAATLAAFYANSGKALTSMIGQVIPMYRGTQK